MLMRRALAPLLLLALGAAACGGDDAPDAATSTSTSEAPATSSSSTTEPAPACDPISLPDGASNITVAAGDTDGDGADDELRSYRLGADDWHLQVELGGGGGADLAIRTYGDDAVVLLGGADVDGDGADEVWARTGSGASATILGVARFVGCQLVRVTFASGDPAELPVGGSVGTASGVSCDGDGDPASDLTAYTATNTGDDQYEVTAIEYELDATVLVQGASEVTTASSGDDTFTRATAFACDDLSL